MALYQRKRGGRGLPSAPNEEGSSDRRAEPVVKGASTEKSEAWQEGMQIHQEFQIPKMEVLNLIRLFWGCVFLK